MLIKGFIKWIIDKTAKYSLLFLLIAFVGIHLLILSIYVNHSRSPASVEAEIRGNSAMRELVTIASKQTPPQNLEKLLMDLTSAGLRIGSYKINMNINPEKLEAGQQGGEPLANKRWLNYEETLSNLAFLVIVLLILLLELGIFSFIVFYAWSVYRFTGPLKEFKSSAERLGIDLRVAPVIAQHAPTLVKETAEAINKMQARIVELINKRTRMLASISHDLRTPITRLKLRTEFIEEQDQAEGIMKDLSEMEEMISGILDFARSDKGGKKATKFDLNALIFSVCDDYIDRGEPVEIEGFDRSAPFWGHPLLLKRTFINLIENAIKYGEKVHVEVFKLSDDLVIYVEDNGKGLPEADIQNVFKAFYRSAYTASDGSAGVGLGLTIAHEVINEHDGELTLENKPEGGLRVIVTLPVWTQTLT